MIALMRSATSTSLPRVKREGSEPVALRSLSQGEINGQRSLLRSSSTTSLQGLRADRKAMVEAELKDAISALRKPDRGVVGKAMAEADQRRVLTSLSAKSKQAKPANKPPSAAPGAHHLALG